MFGSLRGIRRTPRAGLGIRIGHQISRSDDARLPGQTWDNMDRQVRGCLGFRFRPPRLRRHFRAGVESTAPLDPPMPRLRFGHAGRLSRCGARGSLTEEYLGASDVAWWERVSSQCSCRALLALEASTDGVAAIIEVVESSSEHVLGRADALDLDGLPLSLATFGPGAGNPGFGNGRT